MRFRIPGAVVCATTLLGCLPYAARGADIKTPHELMQYIEIAKKQGFKDEIIRQNAVRAGWDASTVDQAFSIVRQPQSAIGNPTVPVGYRIGSGDVLQLVVWKEPEASVASVLVRADGKISVPLL